MPSLRYLLMQASRRRAGLVPGAPASRSATQAGPPRVWLPPGYNQRAGGWLAAPRTAIAVRPAAVPVHHYRTRHRGPIRSDGTSQAFIGAGGGAQVQVGPQGLGTIWELQQAVLATTTGANDASTCALYVGAISIANMIGGQSYAGGGDTVGLTGLQLQTGEFLIAVWSGGHSGDAATIRLSGIEEWLG